MKYNHKQFALLLVASGFAGSGTNGVGGFSFSRPVAVVTPGKSNTIRHGTLLQPLSPKMSKVDDDDVVKIPKAVSSQLSKIDAKQVSLVKRSFIEFDTDKSGGLDPWELKEALNFLDYDVSLPTSMTLMREYDTDRNEQLDLEEFLKLVSDKVPQDVCEVFNTFADDTGFLSPGTLRQALSFLCIDKDSKRSKDLLNVFDANDDGRLGLLGFAEVVSQLPVAKFWLTADPSGRIRKVRTRMLKKLKSAPKKKVSVHSMLSSLSLGMTLLCASLIWAPGVNEFGIFQLTNQFKSFSPSEEIIVKITSILISMVSITGKFRIPPNSPVCRRVIFENSIYFVIGCSTLLLSNIGGMTSTFVLFDAWSLLGKLAILAPTIMAFVTALQLVDDSIAGPMKGRETVPLMTTRPSAFASSIFLIFGVYIQLVQLSAPLLTTKTVASTWIRGMSVPCLLFGGMATASMNAAVPTLRFTNKLGNKGCLGILLASFLCLGFYDGYRSVFVLGNMFARYPDYLATRESIMKLLNNSGVNEIMIGGTVFTILNAFRRKMKSNKKKSKAITSPITV
mmetsp:Transcript_31131/g.75260  ORF Transcript_31131/g.75260 Transcript_31131/m.75260 type:complete len:563 (-) Transcript_31131:144-1832(-)|eukprot:CAMPEP_0181101136 /NCGR_PEP_ID=MMETSP1071-20121207/13585_1 /TAXON_ID=35127 /ORGANISM="Thalassiosira sp., Strain NH16" /LENGTH=562 /DNA_ID=CAMNT_0023183951 /DNA_START=1614 /DNA_END=3302 /DNA_ORIENTATION=-